MSMLEHSPVVRRKDVWMRGLFMLLFVAGVGAAHVVWNVVALVQFIWLLVTGEPSRQLASFGAGLAIWAADAVRFLTFASEDKPFPWREWPASP